MSDLIGTKVAILSDLEEVNDEINRLNNAVFDLEREKRELLMELQHVERQLAA